MKRILMLALMVLSVLSAWAYDFSAKNEDGVEIWYNVLSGSECEVAQNPSNNYKDAVCIPASVTYSGKELSVTSIGDHAFYSCSNITSLEIPNSVTSIGDYAFFLCSYLTSVEIPNSVTSIGVGAFAGCYSLEAIEVDAANQSFCSMDGVLFNKDKTTLLCCSGGKAGIYSIPISVTSIEDMAFSCCISLTSVEIPNSVTSIGVNAFSFCYALTSVVIPNSVTNIERITFWNCSSLTSVVIGNSVTSIGEEAFSDCTSLTSVEIPNSVTSIGKWAFQDCYTLTSVEIGNSVTSIGNYAFSGCSSLTEVKVLAENPPTVRSDAFDYNNSKIAMTLYVPAGTKAKYEAAEVWKDFQNIVELEPEPCAIPELKYIDGKLTFMCTTPGADIHYSYNAGNGDAKDSDALAALQISVYASVEGYADSETVTYNLLDLIKAPADLNGDGRLSAADVTTLVQMVLEAGE